MTWDVGDIYVRAKRALSLLLTSWPFGIPSDYMPYLTFHNLVRLQHVALRMWVSVWSAWYISRGFGQGNNSIQPVEACWVLAKKSELQIMPFVHGRHLIWPYPHGQEADLIVVIPA